MLFIIIIIIINIKVVLRRGYVTYCRIFLPFSGSLVSFFPKISNYLTFQFIDFEHYTYFFSPTFFY